MEFSHLLGEHHTGANHPWLGIGAVDDHIIALGFVFLMTIPVIRPRQYLRLRLRQLTPDEMGEEPDELDLAEIEHDPEESHRRL